MSTATEKNEPVNTNCLEGMACPSCKSEGDFNIGIFGTALVSDDGTVDIEDPDWDDTSPCACRDCTYAGKVSDFREQETPATSKETLEVPEPAATAQPTPKPWYIDCGLHHSIENMIECLAEDKGTKREWVQVGIHDDEGFAASVAYCHPSNAPLIAAAPEMLEWLTYCERYLRHPDVREITRHFSIPPNLIALNELIATAKAERDADTVDQK